MISVHTNIISTNNMWRLWAKAIGEKEGRTDKEADKIAIIRTLIMIQLVVTNGFIVAGNVKNIWGTPQELSQDTTTCVVPSYILTK